MKIKSYADIGAFERQYPTFCGGLIAALLKDRYRIGSDFTKDGPVCFRQSETFLAATAGKDLAAEFDETRAVVAWLQWVEAFRGGATHFGPSTQAFVDWESGVFRTAKADADTPWAYGCLGDVQHGLFNQRGLQGAVQLQPPAGDRLKANLSQAVVNSGDPLTDIRLAEESLAKEPETTRKTLIDARLGQGAFRDSLIVVWAGKCAVTKCVTKALLRASHIKPWRDSTNQERLDQYNGLLLNPVLDAAFDRGLISFSDAGAILFRKEFSVLERELLGLHPKLKLVCVYEENKPYLALHRKLHGFPA